MACELAGGELLLAAANGLVIALAGLLPASDIEVDTPRADGCPL
jgi:hypothetical protein